MSKSGSNPNENNSQYVSRIDGLTEKIDKFLESDEYLDYEDHLAVTCPVCYMTTASKGDFLTHAKSHTLFVKPITVKTNTLHCCFGCALAFMSAREFRTHHDAYHPFNPVPLPGSNLIKTSKS